MTKKPKIMFWDIETCPNLVLDFQCGNNKTVTHNQILEERKVICVSYKYHGEDKVHHKSWKTSGKGVDAVRDDKELVRFIGELLRGCDVAVAHNGDNFDYKWIKGRILKHRLPPLTGVQTIDTYKLSKNNFNLNSQKLDYLSQFLFRKHKLKTDFSLWKSVWLNHKKDLSYMIQYCDEDVRLLEKAFDAMLPYCERLPLSMAILDGGTREQCPVCGGDGNKHGTRVSRVGKYQKYQCKSCAHVWADTRMVK